jgi:hypothetical protein
VAGNKELLAKIVWPHFWAIQIILLMLIVMLLHDARTGARDWEGKGAADILRPMPIPQV